MDDDETLRQELNVTLAAREELGSEMEPAVLDAFLAQIERRVTERAGASDLALANKREHQQAMVLGSMALSIPLLVIAAAFTGLAGVIAICVALALIAIVTAR